MGIIKLTYFDIKARAETSRLILAYAGIQYQDERFPAFNDEEFSTWKDSLRYCQLPVLEDDGEVIYQSMAIARYLAKKYGLGGASNMDNAQIDEVVCVLNDLFDTLVPIYKMKGDERDVKLKEMMEKTVPETLMRLENHLTRRGSQYFAGNAFSWAELHFLNIIDTFSTRAPNLLEQTPKLSDLLARTKALPNIAKWLETRPETII